MEFNDRLHKQMNKKDAIIIRLGQTITMAKIEVCLPTCGLDTPCHDQWSFSRCQFQLVNCLQKHCNQESWLPFPFLSCTNTNFLFDSFHLHRLIEVWIPSVIKKGRGPDTHHAYQVYVKLGGDEWNVYRRFAEFLEFHRQISIHLPEVADFNFPPKKAINNKVENGRTAFAQICVPSVFVFPPHSFSSQHRWWKRGGKDFRIICGLCSKSVASQQPRGNEARVNLSPSFRSR